MMIMPDWSCFILVFSIFTVILAEDFYELLGISNSASTKEIRKAFKKLAITKHPDKNKVRFEKSKHKSRKP